MNLQDLKTALANRLISDWCLTLDDAAKIQNEVRGKFHKILTPGLNLVDYSVVWSSSIRPSIDEKVIELLLNDFKKENLYTISQCEEQIGQIGQKALQLTRSVLKRAVRSALFDINALPDQDVRNWILGELVKYQALHNAFDEEQKVRLNIQCPWGIDEDAWQEALILAISKGMQAETNWIVEAAKKIQNANKRSLARPTRLSQYIEDGNPEPLMVYLLSEIFSRVDRRLGQKTTASLQEMTSLTMLATTVGTKVGHRKFFAELFVLLINGETLAKASEDLLADNPNPVKFAKKVMREVILVLENVYFVDIGENILFTDIVDYEQPCALEPAAFSRRLHEFFWAQMAIANIGEPVDIGCRLPRTAMMLKLTLALTQTEQAKLLGVDQNMIVSLPRQVNEQLRTLFDKYESCDPLDSNPKKNKSLRPLEISKTGLWLITLELDHPYVGATVLANWLCKRQKKAFDNLQATPAATPAAIEELFKVHERLSSNHALFEATQNNVETLKDTLFSEDPASPKIFTVIKEYCRKNNVAFTRTFLSEAENVVWHE